MASILSLNWDNEIITSLDNADIRHDGQRFFLEIDDTLVELFSYSKSTYKKIKYYESIKPAFSLVKFTLRLIKINGKCYIIIRELINQKYFKINDKSQKQKYKDLYKTDNFADEVRKCLTFLYISRCSKCNESVVIYFPDNNILKILTKIRRHETFRKGNLTVYSRYLV